ncbi:MAG: TauD/TfdA family dioxygenase [Rhodobiaceae bacterium]|nr:TauD/TfdA family dioxygenase [Rhodobiaceae bacterium]
MQVRKVGVFIGAEVTGIDLTEPLDAETVAGLKTAHAEHGLLVFPGQRISSADLMRFGRYFGKLTVHPFSTSAAENPELIVYDNKEGNPPLSTDIWHSDETFRECPPMGTMLCSKIVPEVGGDTCFVDMAAVYEGLSERMQAYIAGLEAVHDFTPFKRLFAAREGGMEALRKYEELYPAMTHPLVRVHPVTGRKAIFVNPQFTLYIKGMEPYESRMLLDYFYHRSHTNEYQYRHRWQADMVVFWDNRHAQHSAVHDYYPNRRRMERVTIAGDRPFGEGEPARPEELRRYLMPPIEQAQATRMKRQNEMA